MKNKLIMTMVIFGMTAIGLSQITISGDARVRPRMDVKDWGGYNKSENDSTTHTVDNYHLYRARINIKADIGDGYYFNTKLGHNGGAYWIGSFGTGEKPYDESKSSAGRGTLSFMELYFGLKRDNYGYAIGLLPLKGVPNPGLDLHFYPDKVIDVPWNIYNNDAFHGFSGYYRFGPGKLNTMFSVDNNVIQIVEPLEGETVEAKDQMTIMLNYDLKIAGASLTPWVMATLANEGNAAPITLGANMTGPKIAGFTPAASFFMTSQQADSTEKYTGNIIRAKVSGKVGPGSVYFWYDMATTEWDGGDTHNFSYIWAHYKYVVYKSDKGEFSVKPTVRVATEAIDGSKDYSRSKFELTTEFIF